jgi:Family of unknown function (DUF5681)
MTDRHAPKPPGKVRGRPFRKGQSGNPLGRRVGCRNRTTIAAAALLNGEAEALTRRAVGLALVGEPTAMRLCLERILAPSTNAWSSLSCRRSRVLPRDKARGLKAHDIAAAMKAVTSALAGGMITPGEAATIAAELAVPDLDLIKQDEQGGAGPARGVGQGRSGYPASPVRLVVDTLSGRSRAATSSGVCSWSRPTTSATRAPQLA